MSPSQEFEPKVVAQCRSCLSPSGSAIQAVCSVCGSTEIEDTVEFERARVRIIEEIAEAFLIVTLGDGISLNEAKIIDESGSGFYDRDVGRFREARSRHQERSWQDIPASAIDELDVLVFLDAKGFRYYLPAYMTWCVQNFRTSDSPTVDSIIYRLDPGAKERASHRAWQMQRFCLFDEKQIQAVIAFLKFMSLYEDELDQRFSCQALANWQDVELSQLPGCSEGWVV